MKKSSASEWHRQFKEVREDVKMTHELGSQKHKGQMQMWTEYKPWCAQIED
jgi:hypothetical protein